MNAVIEQPLTAPEPERQKSAYERLTRRQRRFVDEFTAGSSGSESLRRAGYKGLHAHAIAWKWAQRPAIRAAIDERTQQLAEDVGARAYKVVEQVLAIATSDPRKLVDENGTPLPLHQLDAQTAAAVAGVKVRAIRTRSKDGDQPDEVCHEYEYRLWDKNKANDTLGQYLKLWDAERRTVNVDARSVTINNGDGGATAAALRSVLLLGEAIAQGAAAHPDALSGADGSVLPAEVSAQPPGR